MSRNTNKIENQASLRLGFSGILLIYAFISSLWRQVWVWPTFKFSWRYGTCSRLMLWALEPFKFVQQSGLIVWAQSIFYREWLRDSSSQLNVVLIYFYYSISAAKVTNEQPFKFIWKLKSPKTHLFGEPPVSITCLSTGFHHETVDFETVLEDWGPSYNTIQ